MPEGQVIKIEDEKKLDQKSKEIQEIMKNYKEPNLTLYIYIYIYIYQIQKQLLLKFLLKKKVKLKLNYL